MAKADKKGELGKIAAKLRKAEKQGKQVPPISGDIKGMSIDDAYLVQKINYDHWSKRGRRTVGYKIGLTSPKVQQQLGVDQPDYGALFADMAFLDGEEISFSRVIQPKAEAEVALVLERDLAPAGAGERDGRGPFTVADIIGATGYALPCIEVVDSRIKDWKIGIADTIADNASSALFVLGNCPRKLEGLDLRLCGMTLECGGYSLSTGAGAACLGHPLNAATWLANIFCQRGILLRAGDIILTGALGPMTPAEPGKAYEARISGLGSVRAVFSGKEK